jgi:hypothetical protein
MSDWQSDGTRIGRLGSSWATQPPGLSVTSLPGLGLNVSPEVATTMLNRLYPIERFAKFFYLALVVLILFFATSVAATSQHNSWQAAGEFLRVAGCSVLIASAAATVGCLIGFLFGIPRSQISQIAAQLRPPTPQPQQEMPREQTQSGEPQSGGATQQGWKPQEDSQKGQTPFTGQDQIHPERTTKMALATAPTSQGPTDRASSPFLINTSMEEISDWLTKIIIGLSLVQFHSFLQTLKAGAIDAAKFIVPSAASVGDAWPFFFGLMVASFLSAGFLVYLETRTRLTLLFVGALKLEE